MICLILAAGYATRLYPLTENFPNPLLKVGEKTILDHLTDDINGGGKVSEFIVIYNHKFAHHFEEWAKTKPYKITEVDDGTSTNETRLGAVKDIKFAIDTLNLNDDMLIIARDNVLDFSLNKFVDYAVEKNASCVMKYFEPEANKLKKAVFLKLMIPIWYWECRKNLLSLSPIGVALLFISIKKMMFQELMRQ